MLRLLVLRALKCWLGALKWTKAGEVSNIELAIDFEVFTGLDLPGRSPLTALQRGKVVWKILAAFLRQCSNLGLPEPLPAKRASRVGCLTPLGAPFVWGGLSLRPLFAGGEETMVVLERSLARKGVPSETWGNDLFPDYSGIPRHERAAKWDCPSAMPERAPLPLIVPKKIAGFELGGRLCQAHRKPKCSLCQQMRRNYSLVVDACCQAHHAPDDGLPVECCVPHRMTRCGTCPTAARCCKKGHHVIESADPLGARSRAPT